VAFNVFNVSASVLSMQYTKIFMKSLHCRCRTSVYLKEIM